MLEFAIKLAKHLHRDQTYNNIPYFYHPFSVMEKMDTEDEKIVAILHDVVEDTPITFDALFQLGFTGDILEAIKLLTREHNEEYALYIEKIKPNKLATKVKIADLKFNLSKLPEFEAKEQRKERMKERYLKALKFLEK